MPVAWFAGDQLHFGMAENDLPHGGPVGHARLP